MVFFSVSVCVCLGMNVPHSLSGAQKTTFWTWFFPSTFFFFFEVVLWFLPYRLFHNSQEPRLLRDCQCFLPRCPQEASLPPSLHNPRLASGSCWCWQPVNFLRVRQAPKSPAGPVEQESPVFAEMDALTVTWSCSLVNCLRSSSPKAVLSAGTGSRRQQPGTGRMRKGKEESSPPCYAQHLFVN